jgi:hypothetical protein
MSNVESLPVRSERGWHYLERGYREVLLNAGANPKRIEGVLQEMEGYFFQLNEEFSTTLNISEAVALSEQQITALRSAFKAAFDEYDNKVYRRHIEALGIILSLIAEKHGAF